MESIYHKDSNMFRLLNKVKSCSAETVLGWVTKYEYPLFSCNNFFFLFFPFLFQGDIKESRNCHHCVMSFLSCLSTLCFSFAMAVLCVFRRYKYIEQWDTSFEFSSILLTVDLSKHLIMVESFENSYSSSIL